MTATHVDKALAKRRAYEAQVRVGNGCLLHAHPTTLPSNLCQPFQELLIAGAEADKLNYTAGAEVCKERCTFLVNNHCQNKR